MSAFAPSFYNREITGRDQYLLKIIWNIAFPKWLRLFICSKSKNIWKIWNVSNSFNYLI